MTEPVETRIDPSESSFITIVGKKGSGKSVLAQRFWDSYPFDRLVIDPTADIDPGPDTKNLHAPLPGKWPLGADGERVSLRFVPNRLDPAHVDDMDRAVGLVYFASGPKMLWVDEVAELTSATSTPPHFDLALHQGRHVRLTLLMCGPRPMKINPLVMSQADFVYVFWLPNPADRKRVAETIGWDPQELDALILGLPQYHYLRYDAVNQTLDQFPPIPLRRKPAYRQGPPKR